MTLYKLQLHISIFLSHLDSLDFYFVYINYLLDNDFNLPTQPIIYFFCVKISKNITIITKMFYENKIDTWRL